MEAVFLFMDSFLPRLVKQSFEKTRYLQICTADVPGWWSGHYIFCRSVIDCMFFIWVVLFTEGLILSVIALEHTLSAAVSYQLRLWYIGSSSLGDLPF